MPLHWYRRPRLVVLNPDTPVFDAARAIEQNRIGAVVVQEQGRVVGIVTDRDLAVRALGRGLDPRTTRLDEVMTRPVATLSPSDSHADAIRLMQERNIRRIPLVEDARIVGIVTLDDLLIDEAAAPDDLAAVVAAQIGEGGPADTARSPARRRSAARAGATLGRLLNQVRAQAEVKDADQAETAVRVVLASVVRRLTADEARHFVAQLPSLLQPELRALPPGPDKGVTRETIEADLAQQLDVDPAHAARLLDAVGTTVAQTVSPGQMDDVRRQLPQGLRSVFAVPSLPADVS